jgi:hypothetical protein
MSETRLERKHISNDAVVAFGSTTTVSRFPGNVRYAPDSGRIAASQRYANTRTHEIIEVTRVRGSGHSAVKLGGRQPPAPQPKILRRRKGELAIS